MTLRKALTDGYTHCRRWEEQMPGLVTKLTIELVGVHIQAWARNPDLDGKIHSSNRIVPWDEIERAAVPLEFHIDKAVIALRTEVLGILKPLKSY